MVWRTAHQAVQLREGRPGGHALYHRIMNSCATKNTLPVVPASVPVSNGAMSGQDLMDYVARELNLGAPFQLKSASMSFFDPAVAGEWPTAQYYDDQKIAYPLPVEIKIPEFNTAFKDQLPPELRGGFLVTRDMPVQVHMGNFMNVHMPLRDGTRFSRDVYLLPFLFNKAPVGYALWPKTDGDDASWLLLINLQVTVIEKGACFACFAFCVLLLSNPRAPAEQYRLNFARLGSDVFDGKRKFEDLAALFDPPQINTPEPPPDAARPDAARPEKKPKQQPAKKPAAAKPAAKPALSDVRGRVLDTGLVATMQVPPPPCGGVWESDEDVVCAFFGDEDAYSVDEKDKVYLVYHTCLLCVYYDGSVVRNVVDGAVVEDDFVVLNVPPIQIEVP